MAVHVSKPNVSILKEPYMHYDARFTWVCKSRILYSVRQYDLGNVEIKINNIFFFVRICKRTHITYRLLNKSGRKSLSHIKDTLSILTGTHAQLHWLLN